MESHLGQDSGLTDGILPRKLAQAVCATAALMEPLDVVAALDKCQNMAFKAKVLNGKLGSKGNISDLRAFVASQLLGQGGRDGTTGTEELPGLG